MILSRLEEVRTSLFKSTNRSMEARYPALSSMEILTPGGGFQGYFDEHEQIVASMTDEEHRKARAELGERYGVSWHRELIPKANARFGIGS
jgi:hypothetical protein